MSFRSNHILLLELKLSLTSPESKYGVFPSLNCPFTWLVLCFLSFSFKALQCLHCYDTLFIIWTPEHHINMESLSYLLWEFHRWPQPLKERCFGTTQGSESLFSSSLYPVYSCPQRKISESYFKAAATLWAYIDRRTREIRYNRDCFPGKVIEKRHCSRGPVWVERGNCLQLFPLSLVSGSLWWLCVWGLLLRHKLQSLNLEFFLRT